MAEITHRKVIEYKWICTNKELCEQLDEQIEKIVFHQSQLSHYVETKEITGLECLVIEGKFKYALLSLQKERKILWRRVPKITEEEVIVEDTAKIEAGPVYTSPFAKPNMERVL